MSEANFKNASFPFIETGCEFLLIEEVLSNGPPKKAVLISKLLCILSVKGEYACITRIQSPVIHASSICNFWVYSK